MIIQITNISIRYNEGAVDGVQVFFNGHDEERTVNVNGNFPLTSDEYEGNESIPFLVEIVKQKVTDKLSNQSA